MRIIWRLLTTRPKVCSQKCPVHAVAFKILKRTLSGPYKQKFDKFFFHKIFRRTPLRFGCFFNNRGKDPSQKILPSVISLTFFEKILPSCFGCFFIYRGEDPSQKNFPSVISLTFFEIF